ncbi:hypothetical protein MAUB1S_04828 [Mycolicibacterium aubagnense]
MSSFQVLGAPTDMNIHWRHQHRAATTYEIVDQLHDRHAVGVPADRVAATVAGWLAELDVHSPLTDDLARATQRGDWPTTHTICDQLSIAVMIAA